MFDSQIIKHEFERNLQLVKDDPFSGGHLISYTEVLKAHFLIIDFFSSTVENLTYGVKDFNLLGSTLGRQIAGYGSFQKWKRPEDICATLFYGIIKNHAFHDANKRTALLTLLYHLLKLGRTIDAKQREFENLALCVASDSLNEYRAFKENRYQKLEDKEIVFLADFIRGNTREIEKKYYPVTYQEFDRLLRRHGFNFEISRDGFVDVVGESVRKKFFGLVEQKIQKRYIQVGFPGWKRQINPKAVKEIFKATGLTADNGIDSKVFFWDAEPLAALIDQYKNPLIRLKDK
jgi:death-on-curing family protein